MLPVVSSWKKIPGWQWTQGERRGGGRGRSSLKSVRNLDYSKQELQDGDRLTAAAVNKRAAMLLNSL